MADFGDDYRSIWAYLMQTPFQQNYIDVGGVRTRYIQAGPKDGPPLILVHGTGGHWESFCANIPAYAEHFNTYAFDMVGAGFSGKPDKDYEIPDLVTFTRDFMLAIGVEKASLIGVSLGAWTCARLAITFPEMADKIVLISPVGIERLHPQADGGSEEQMQRRAEIVRDTSWEKTRSIFKGMIHKDEDIIPDLVKVRQVMHRLPNAERDMRHVLVIGKSEVYARGSLSDEALASIKSPTLIFMSEFDIPFFRKAAQEMSQLIPNATLISLSGAAHWAQFEQADYFNAATLAFLKGQPIPAQAQS